MKYIITTILLLSFVSAHAVSQPRNGRLDPRIKHVQYQDGQVYQIHTHYLQETLVYLSEEEKIVHVGVGDSLAWQITPIQNYLSIKPVLEKADTNVNILTEHAETGAIRSYVFELNAHETHGVENKSGTFLMKFSYPEDELAKRIKELETQRAREERKEEEDAALLVSRKKIAAEEWNLEYSYAGNTSIVPVRTFDDGEFTYFQFQSKVDFPAIFLVNEDGSESIVNFHVSDKYVVVHKIAKQFILRDGSKATCIYNNGLNVNEQTILKENSTVIIDGSEDDDLEDL